MRRPTSRGRIRRRRGISATSCWSPTSTASRRRSRSASGISRPSRTPASSRSSTGRSPSRPTAIRWSARCAACPASGSPAASWPASARAAASAWRSSNWMIDGDPGADIWAMDVSRYGDWASMAYTNAKVRENYSRRFSIRFPNEELPAGRPLKTTPVYDLLCGAGAQWGVSFGLEVPLWFAPEGVKDEFSWRRSTDFEHVAKEVRTVRERRRPVGDFQLRQIHGDRRGRRGLARPGAGLQAAEARPHDADADAQGRRQADRRFHARQSRRQGRVVHRRLGHRRAVPHALVREASARGRLGHGRGARPRS